MSLTIINKQSNKEISQRKLETYEKYMQILIKNIKLISEIKFLNIAD